MTMFTTRRIKPRNLEEANAEGPDIMVAFFTETVSISRYWACILLRIGT